MSQILIKITFGERNMDKYIFIFYTFYIAIAIHIQKIHNFLQQ